jgi:hypothetical protein
MANMSVGNTLGTNRQSDPTPAADCTPCTSLEHVCFSYNIRAVKFLSQTIYPFRH